MNTIAAVPALDGRGTAGGAPLNLGMVTAPQTFHQLGIFVLDGSGSMTDQTPDMMSKGEATDLAARELLTLFKSSSAKNCFSFAAVAFDTSADTKMQPNHLVQIDEFAQDFNPLAGHGGGTNIGAGLLEAERIVTEFFANQPSDGVPASAVLLLMSDGGHNEGPDVKTVADQIKASSGGRVTICAALFATVGSPDPAGEATLKSIVTDPNKGFSRVYRPEDLRNFFKASVARASGVQLR